MAEFSLRIGINAAGAKKGANEIFVAFRKIRKSSIATEAALRRTEKQALRTGRSFGFLRFGLVAFFALRAGKKIIDLADNFKQFQNRVRLVTGSEEELNIVSAELIRQSKESFVTLASQAQVFQRVSKGAAEFGFSQLQALQTTEALALAVRISGGSAESANAALVQLGQGIAAGELRGQELRSVLEQTPRVAQALAVALDTTVGKLIAFGEAGKINVERIIPGLISQIGKLKEEAALLTPTFDQAMTNVTTDLTVAVGAFDDVVGAVTQFGDTVVDVADVAIPFMIDQLISLSVFTNQAVDQIGATGLFLISVFEGAGDAVSIAGEEVGFLTKVMVNLQTPVSTMLTVFQLLLVGIFQGLKNLFLAPGIALRALRVQITKAEIGIKKFFGTDTTEIEKALVSYEAGLAAVTAEQEANDAAALLAQTAILAQGEAAKVLNVELREALEIRKAELVISRDDLAARLAAAGVTRAGGIDPDAPVATSASGAISVEDIAKFNAANDAAEAFRQEMQEIQKLAKAGALKTAVDSATADAAATLKEALTGISAEDVKSFTEANDASAAYAARLAEIAVLASEGAGATALAEATRLAREEYDDATGALDMWNDQLERAKKITEGVLTPTEELAKGIKEVNELLDADFISDEVAKRRIAQLEEAVNQTNFMRDVAKAAAEDIQEAFRDLFLEGTDSLEDFASQFGETLRRVAANFLANQAIQFLLGENFDGGAGAIGGVAGKIGGLFGGGGGTAIDTTPTTDTIGEAAAQEAGINIGQAAAAEMATAATGPGGIVGALAAVFSSIGSGVGSAVGGIASLFGGFFADGGSLAAGKFGIVGEGGPEVITGPATITPMGGMMPAPEVNVSIANISDPRAAVEAVGATNAGAKGIVNQISENVEEIQRILGQA